MQMGSKQGFSFVCTPVGSFDFSSPILFLWYLQRLRTPDWNLECLHANAVPEQKKCRGRNKSGTVPLVYKEKKILA